MIVSIRKTIKSKLNFIFVQLVELIRLFAVVVLNLLHPLPKILINSVLFAPAGIKINGPNPWDIQVLDDRFYALAVSSVSAGIMEAYRKKYFEVEDLEQFVLKLFSLKIVHYGIFIHPYTFALTMINKYFDVQTTENAWKAGGENYDTGIEWFKLFCDPSMHHSCANFESKTIDQLEEASYHNREVIAKKLKLRPKMNVLDIGCGFGSLAKHLASRYEVNVTGVTVSKEMAKYGAEDCKGLNVNIMLKDYREIDGLFDRITCIEMMEHIGYSHYREFFEIVHKHLKDDGIFLLQVVSLNNQFGSYFEPVFEKHLGLRVTFPNISTLIDKASGLFVIEHMHNIGYDYGLTWSAWLNNLRKNWPAVSHLYPEDLYRLWSLYFAGGSGLQTRIAHNFQIVFAKKAERAVYRFD